MEPRIQYAQTEEGYVPTGNRRSFTPGHVEEGINIFRDSATLKGFEKPVRLHEVRWHA